MKVPSKMVKSCCGGLALVCAECDFEESHLCGYSNQWNANVNWYVGGGGGHEPPRGGQGGPPGASYTLYDASGKDVEGTWVTGVGYLDYCRCNPAVHPTVSVGLHRCFEYVRPISPQGKPLGPLGSVPAGAVGAHAAPAVAPSEQPRPADSIAFPGGSPGLLVGLPPPLPKLARACMQRGEGEWGGWRGTHDRRKPQTVAATVIRQFQQGGAAHADLWHSFVSFTSHDHKDPDRCLDAAEAFAPLADEYRDLAAQLGSGDWGVALTQEVTHFFKKCPPDEGSRNYLTQQPAIVARRVMSEWNPRNKTSRAGDHYGAYYISMIHRAHSEVASALHWEGRSWMRETRKCELLLDVFFAFSCVLCDCRVFSWMTVYMALLGRVRLRGALS